MLIQKIMRVAHFELQSMGSDWCVSVAILLSFILLLLLKKLPDLSWLDDSINMN